ncbi:MAG: undecaprenyl/decaprenyl-phosphate alpha-N-acetylglucosaminyl 1-phosphate transferase [Coriobacteriaceae bacterium]|nr:MraY family glycosyltransferase [Atopobium sp. oral taxon 416]QUC04920.1 undecaprenyl/decaprenyl-phosphate alpha-N-acetylglucosaminyl 1-phosphate transferase [Atopobium sp. oral taxon 416]RRF98978.1 MAG: undecaprenyl/decaprenyl-phosphate alpha-N-acetylglucosaminyl 1-phosphate transferase [Coriobacteriaceae bacterium]
MQHWLPYFILFAAACITALLVTPLASKIAWKVDAVDRPEARRINTKPIPRMGGIAIFVALLVTYIMLFSGLKSFQLPLTLMPPRQFSVDYQILGLAVVVIFVTGLLDDKFTLKPHQKLIGQILAGIIAAASGLVLGSIINPFTGKIMSLGLWTYPITVLYLVAYTNIINLIDGLDGLASGIGMISSLTMFILAFGARRFDAAALAISLAGACLGFLRYNFHPASIFLGDSGSMLIGFMLGTISLLNVTRIAGLTTIIIPLVVAGIPIMDTFSAIIRRLRGHVSISQADRGHIHHRLIAEGYDQRQAVLVMYAWTIVLCIGAYVMTQVEMRPRIVIFIVLIIVSFFFGKHLRLFEPVLLHHQDPKTGTDKLITPDDPAFKEEEEKIEHETPLHH